MKICSDKDYWGTHPLENKFANQWVKKSFQMILDQVRYTFKTSNNILEFRAACWTLIRLGIWFNELFDMSNDYAFAIAKIKTFLEQDIKVFQDTEDNQGFRASIEQQLRELTKLKKDLHNEWI